MSSYFSHIPNFDYVSRLPDAKISDYAPVKNLFRKAKIRDDIFKNVSFFERYKIIGDDRPDNVAYEVYNDASLDWVVLLSNNILNIQTEWPLTQRDFDAVLIEKYGDYVSLYDGIHHYETIEVKNRSGVTIVPAGLQVPSDYSVTYYDESISAYNIEENIVIPVTNYEYEEKLENEKRNIFILKQEYLGIILNDMKEIMEYKEGSSQFVTRTLKRGDNIRLYQ